MPHPQNGCSVQLFPASPDLAYISNLLGGKQMKKLISLLLVLAMALALVACGSSAPAATEAPAADAPAAL